MSGTDGNFNNLTVQGSLSIAPTTPPTVSSKLAIFSPLTDQAEGMIHLRVTDPTLTGANRLLSVAKHNSSNTARLDWIVETTSGDTPGLSVSNAVNNDDGTSSNSPNLLHIAWDGKVGIGSIPSSAKLEVAGTVKASSFEGDGATLTGALTVQSSLTVSGNVGIGTTPSLEKLAIAGNALIEGDLYLNRSDYVSLHYGNRGKLGGTPSFNPDNDNNGLWLEASHDGESGGIFCNGNTIVLWSPGDNDTLRIYDEDDFSSPKFVINNEGNVGIGTTSPAAKLEISDSFRGSLKFLATSGVGHDFGYDGGSDNSFWFTHYGTEGGETKFVWDNGSGVRDLLVIKNDGQLIGRQIQPSSRKLKENIVALSSQEALKTLKELNPVKFNYRGDSQEALNVGFIAEDVPDLVATSDRKGLSPIDIVAVLTKVVKEQQNTISVLVEKIKAIEGKQH